MSILIKSREAVTACSASKADKNTAFIFGKKKQKKQVYE